MQHSPCPGTTLGGRRQRGCEEREKSHSAEVLGAGSLPLGREAEDADSETVLDPGPEGRFGYVGPVMDS